MQSKITSFKQIENRFFEEICRREHVYLMKYIDKYIHLLKINWSLWNNSIGN